MDWLLQYWPYLLAVLLIGLLAVRLVTMLPRFRQPTRHSGERVIRVIGVGGAGGNAINHMIRAKQRGVEYVAVNTDVQVLDESLAMRRVQIGEKLTQGLGAGGDATIGREAAVEDEDELGRMVTGSDLVFIAAGLGGGTGSGAAPVIAKKAREAGALTVGVVTKPFTFEGAGRRKVADEAEAELKANVDTLLLIQNEKVIDMIGEETSMLEAFRVVNEVLARTVRAIVDVMTVPGLINLDFADVRSIMRDGGTATTGIGWASGPDRAVEAAHAAVNNPLLDHDISGAGAILLNVAGASTMSMREVTRAADEIRNVADPEASIIFGTIFDDHLGDELRVTVIATRFSDRPDRPVPAAVPVAVEAPESPIASEPPPIPAPVLEEQQPIEAPAAFAPVASWQEAAIEPESASGPEPEPEPIPFKAEAEPEPEAVGFEAAEPVAQPVGFHVAAEDEHEPVTPWYVNSAPTLSETPEASTTSEQPMSSSVATVLAALAEEPAPPAGEEEQPTAAYQQHEAPTPTYEERSEATASASAYDQRESEAAVPAFEEQEAPAPTYLEQREQPAPTGDEREVEAAALAYEQEAPYPTYFERAEAKAPAYEQEQPTAAYEQEQPIAADVQPWAYERLSATEQPAAAYAEPSAAHQQPEAPAPTSYDMPEEPEVSEPAADSPALPQGLAEILRDEPEPVAAEATEPQPYEPPASAPSPVAPRTSTPPHAPVPARQEPVRTPTSALVGRFWSRIGKSQR